MVNGDLEEAVKSFEGQLQYNVLSRKEAKDLEKDLEQVIEPQESFGSELERFEKTCRFCGKYFKRKHQLKLHVKIHTREGWIPCDICNREYRDKTKLKDHKEEVHLKIKYYCDRCGSAFSRKNLLYKHIKMHDGVAKYKCDVCGKCYYKRDSYESHVNKYHTGKTPYVCEMCGKGFVCNNVKLRHKKFWCKKGNVKETKT